MIDKELILKLIRLANNNPNEHEANLAARKACKLIEEGKLLEAISKPIVNMGTPHGTWNDVKRSTEPFWKAYPFDEDFFRGSYTDQEKQTEERFNRAKEERKTTEAKEHIRREQDRQRQDKQRQGRYYDEVKYWTEYGEPFYTPPSERKEKRNLTCKKCRNTVSTAFVGLPEAFICNKCSWTEFEEKRK